MKKIFVSLGKQRLYAFDGRKRVFEFRCVSGDSSHRTKVGEHTIVRKHKIYRSKKYDVQMNFAMFFYRGQAIHEAVAVDIMSEVRALIKQIGLDKADPFGSHGCIRLSSSNARKLFGWATMRTPVIISKGKPKLPDDK
ncbi:L,D-transpeptidase [Ruegeria sp. HKCCA6707]|uniref:L,D-transpeptidase n=1 Tax=unclassified Ruegeria TaxID=2625375 RepID=UPI001488F1EA